MEKKINKKNMKNLTVCNVGEIKKEINERT